MQLLVTDWLHLEHLCYIQAPLPGACTTGRSCLASANSIEELISKVPSFWGFNSLLCPATYSGAGHDITRLQHASCLTSRTLVVPAHLFWKVFLLRVHLPAGTEKDLDSRYDQRGQ